MSAEPIDVAYTWVDDAWPGYREQLHGHARNRHDLNPNRTRDNLDLLRYSLRSIATYAPWVRNVYLLSCRPQIPRWLDESHPRLRIVHHDEIMAPAFLPTFSSFAIVLHLDRLPGISRRFLYFEDDMLLGAPVGREDFLDAEARLRVYPRLGRTAAASRRDDARISPWNAALARANYLLDRRYGRARRWVSHAPLLVDRDLWSRMLAQWPEEIGHTRASRFRSTGDVAPEYLYVHYALGEGRAKACPMLQSYRQCFYFPLENRLLQVRLQEAIARRLRPKFITLNDNFGKHPNPAVVAFMRGVLRRWHPCPSPFERSERSSGPRPVEAEEIGKPDIDVAP